jgi:hypothetical protein
MGRRLKKGIGVRPRKNCGLWATGSDLSRSLSRRQPLPRRQVGAPSPVTSPQPAAGGGGAGREEDEGEGRGAEGGLGDNGREDRRGSGPGQGAGHGPLTQDATRNRVWGRRAKLTGSKAAPARPAPNEAPSMAGPGCRPTPVPSVRLSVRPAPPEAAGGCCRGC